jgi:hypothetical protein
MTALLATVAATRSAYATLRRKPPGGSARWARTNHAGRTVDLYGGLAAATGTVLATAAAPGLPGPEPHGGGTRGARRGRLRGV